MEPKVVNLNKEVLKYALLLSLVNVIISLLIYLINPGFFGSFWLVVILFFFGIGVYILLSILVRRSNGGFISFKQLFMSLFTILIIAGFISEIFNALLFTVIDPQLPEIVKQSAKQNTYKFMQRWNTPQEKIDETMDKIDKQDFTPTVKTTSTRIIWIGVWSAVMALIFAAIFKKKNTINYESLLDSGQNQQG